MKTDEQIRRNVIEEIESDPQLSGIATQIGVTVKDEVVTLSGMVDYFSQKLAAEKATHRVKDVKVVAVDIEVKGVGSSGRVTDTALAEAVHNALSWHSAVNDDLVNIKVEDGWVYLDGMVDWDYERQAAEKSVGSIKGVKGIINRVKIKQQQVDPVEVEKKIKAAFLRHANIDSARIHVKTSGYKVVLTGSVRSRTERKDAEEVAWQMPGVTEVENKLEVEYQTVGD